MVSRSCTFYLTWQRSDLICLFVCLRLLHNFFTPPPSILRDSPRDSSVFLPHLTTAEVVTIRNGNKLPAERQRSEVGGVGKVRQVREVREKALLSATEWSFKDVAHVQQQQRQYRVASCKLPVHRHRTICHFAQVTLIKLHFLPLHLHRRLAFPLANFVTTDFNVPLRFPFPFQPPHIDTEIGWCLNGWRRRRLALHGDSSRNIGSRHSNCNIHCHSGSQHIDCGWSPVHGHFLDHGNGWTTPAQRRLR